VPQQGDCWFGQTSRFQAGFTKERQFIEIQKDFADWNAPRHRRAGQVYPGGVVAEVIFF
jgi:hypothetical protein